MPPRKPKPVPGRRPVEVITGPIASDRTFGRATTWVIAGEVHVRRDTSLITIGVVRPGDPWYTLGVRERPA